MPDRTPQSFENHARWVPLFHFGVFGVLVLNLLWCLFRLVTGPSWPSALEMLMALAFLGMFFYMRIFALTVQDRVIRLEMRLRLRELVPPDLVPRIASLTRHQLVALRFASDEELAALVREVLENNITSRREIKRRIKRWQPDDLRA
jgi:hypothetical protein